MHVILLNITLTIVFLLTSYLFFYIPGKVVNSTILKNKNDFLLSFAIGFSLFTLVSFIIYELNIKILHSIIIFSLIDTVIIFFFYKIIFRNKITTKKFIAQNSISIFSILGLILLLILIKPIYLNHDGADMWSFMSMIRSYIDDGYFSNISPWFDTGQSAYPSNAFFLYLTIIKYLSPNSSIFDIFLIGGILLIILSILINIQVLNLFIKNIKNSFSIILFIFILSFLLKDNLVSIMTHYPFYPKVFSGLIFIPILIYIFFSRIYLKKFFPIFLTLIFISFVNQSSINLMISLILVFIFLIIEKNFEIFIKKIINICIPIIITLLFVFFYLIDFYFAETGVISTYSNDLEINTSGKNSYLGQIIEIFQGYFIYDPIKYFIDFKYYYLIILALSLLIYKKIINRKLLLYHYLMLIVSFLIVFNPVSIFILNKLMPINFLIRINLIFMGYIFLGYIIFNIIEDFKYKKYIYNFLIIFSILSSFVFSGFYYFKYNNFYTNNFKELEQYLGDIKNNSFTVTDKFTSNKVLALKKVKILITNESWIRAATPKENFKIYYNIYDKNDLLLNKDIINFLNSMDVDYFLINKQKTNNYKILEKFNSLKNIFENELFLLYEI